METTTCDVTPPEAGSRSGIRPTPDPTRTGALWVGGTGVALLLAAAAVLTAVRWDDIGQSAKLGGLLAITSGLLALGRRLRTVVPVTAQTIFHLGALLVPFDMAAVAILAGQPWQQTLLLASGVSAGAWYGINRTVPSTLLTWCARFAVIGAVAGIAAVSPIALPLALAPVALGAVAARRSTAATTWAIAAGVLPLGWIVPWPSRIAGAAADLGFVAESAWQLLVAGVVAVGVTALLAGRHGRIEMAWMSVVLAATTAIVAVNAAHADGSGFLIVALLFAFVETLAFAARGDVLWKPVLSRVARSGEMVGAVLTGVYAVDGALSGDATATLATAGVFMALGWLTADRRRLEESADWLTGLVMGSDWPVTTVMFPLAVLGIVGFAGGAAGAAALTMLALGYWMVATWRRGGHWGAIALVVLAVRIVVPPLAEADGLLELVVAGFGAVLLALAARLRVRTDDLLGALSVAVVAVVVWFAWSESLGRFEWAGLATLSSLCGAWALSWMIDVRAAGARRHPAAWVGRIAAIAIVATGVWFADPWVAIAICGAVATLAAVDWYRCAISHVPTIRNAQRFFALIGGAAIGLAGPAIAELAGLDSLGAGVALTLAGLVAVGFALVVPAEAEFPFAGAAAVLSATGLVMAAGAPWALALAVIVVGTTVGFLGAALRDATIGVAGFVIVTTGVSLQLSVWQIAAVEPYLILPAIAALTVGHYFHRRGASSWVAHTPTIAVLSYVAIVDRVTGGSAWHAVFAGTIGVMAVIAGGYRRLAGPLVAGSMVLAVVVGYESLGPAALVPTWAWLAVGGVVLLAAGVALERSDTTPLERGQQMRRIVTTQFS